MQLKLIQMIFSTLAIILGALYGMHYSSEIGRVNSFFLALMVSGTMVCLVIAISKMVKETSLKTFNISFLGIFFGCFIAQLMIELISAADILSLFDFPKEHLLFLKPAIYLTFSYLGLAFIWKAQDSWTLSIPFVRLMPTDHRKKDFILDAAILADPRIIDLAATGLFDQSLILPRFVFTELRKGIEHETEIEKLRCKRAVEVFQKLEEIPGLHLKIVEHDFPEIKDLHHKLIQLARLLDAHILTADPNGIHNKTYEGVRCVNIFSLSNALKPIVQTEESLSVKIQRYGKEPLQGVGYLDDGTMVVVNGGADFLGESIQVQVLSVKHTPTGRMIFCNSTHKKKAPLLKPV